MSIRRILVSGATVVVIFIFIVICTGCKHASLFESVPASKTNIAFVNKLEQHKLFSILYYLYYYNGGGVSTGDINNDGLPDIYFTANNKGGNKLYLNKGNFVFEDITDKARVAGNSDWCTGVTMADVNADGFLDIYVSTVSQKYNLKGHNELYINNGNLTFSERSTEYGLNAACFTTQSAFFDYDRDGDLDCYILNQSHHPHANIVDTGNRRKYDTLSGDRLYRNDLNTPAKRFTDVSASVGIYQSNLGYGLGLGIGDINNDGWDDIYIGNDFHENDYYYVNNGNGTFTESSSKHFQHYSRFSMGNDIADYNNDGQLDIITVDMLPPDEKFLKTYGSDENPDAYKVKLELRGYQKQYSKNCLQRNNGNGISFSETALQSGVSATDWSWAPLFADFDNDGNKDLFISSGIVKRPVDLDYVKFVSDLIIKKNINQTDQYDKETIDAMPGGSSHPWFFKGDGDINFKEVSKEWGTSKMKGFFCGAAWADLNNDGNIDMVINNIDAPATILKNNAPAKNHIAISFKGDSLNTSGIGVKSYLFTHGKMQYQQLMSTRGFQSSCELRIHFGLDTTTMADSMVIVWPNQRCQTLKNIQTGKLIRVNYNDADRVFNYTNYFPAKQNVYRDITASVDESWYHIENDFLDYNRQYLIPHQLSTRGPRIAVADINKDGLDDIYVCAAAAYPGMLGVQNQKGRFVKQAIAVKDRIRFTEEVDAIFFDANNDTWPDLYVVSGGNEYDDGNPGLKDNLYINDGKGNLKQQLNTIPAIAVNKSCVSAADIDADGDTDLFVGGLANAKAYGLPQTSYMLINDGAGNFKPADSSVISLRRIGMVTSSAFTDFNKDGWQDLIITGEWMPVKIFLNNKGKFISSDIESSTGLWQRVYTTDVNDDGFTDILAGNWGRNSKLHASKTNPLKLYVKDFDKNGSSESIIAYSVDGKEYTFLAKDELERALPILKKAYLTYKEVAGETIQYMFYDLFKDYIELKAEVLSSSCFVNDGKGNFTRINLPDNLQMAPLMAFAGAESKNSFICGGNFYGVIPYEGRYDALPPSLLSFDDNRKLFSSAILFPDIEGEVRDIKWIKTIQGKQMMIIVRNSRELLFFTKP